MNKINDFLRRFPRFRAALILIIRYLQFIFYSILNRIKGRKKEFITTGRLLTPPSENCFFGYYDKSPYNTDGTSFLYHRVRDMDGARPNEKADIFIQNTDGSRQLLGQTLAWNLQQGAMLRFYTDHVVAWNDYRNGEYCCVFHSLTDHEERVIASPLYDISLSGRYGLTLDFERLNIDAEGYGYIQKGLTQFPDSPTISLIDIPSEQVRVLIDNDALNKQFPIKHTGVDFFYFNHLNFNPSAARFIFIQRYVYNRKRYSRLFTADIQGDHIHLLADEDMVSHFTWVDDETILVWCRHNGKDAYYLIQDEDTPSYQAIGTDKLREDGHPTFERKKQVFVSDTYPDKARLRHLFTYSTVTGELKELAGLYAPIKYDGPRRCDFHPRFRPDYLAVCIDSIHDGHRGLYEISVK